MNMIKPQYIAGLLAVAAFTTACSEKMPDVNEENCTQASIQQIEDSKIRSQFSDKCFDLRMEQAEEKASSLLDQSQDSTQQLLDDSKEAAADAYESTADAMQDSAEALGDAWEEGVDAVQEGVDAVQEGANKAAEELDAATN